MSIGLRWEDGPKIQRHLFAIALSAVLLGAIIWLVDYQAFIAVWAGIDVTLTVAAFALLIPIAVIIAYRLTGIVPNGNLPFAEALRLILVAAVLNMFLPSKMGDVAKSYFLKDRYGLSGSLSLSLVLYEKIADLVSLLLWCLFGLAFLAGGPLFWGGAAVVIPGIAVGMALLGSRRTAGLVFSSAEAVLPARFQDKVIRLGDSWEEAREFIWADRTRFIWLMTVSALLWLLLLGQIWLFILALGFQVPFLVNLSMTPLAILAGLLPLTFAGIGTRDAGFVFFFSGHLDPSAAAALGILTTLRMVILALAGVPFLSRYITFKKTAPPDRD